jgi:sugar phosphate permease
MNPDRLGAAEAARFRRVPAVSFALAACAFVLAFFHRVSLGAITGELQQAFAVGGAALGALAATYFYVYTLMQIPTGVLVDTLGPRRVVAVGGLVAGIGSVMFGFAPTWVEAALGRTLVGLGVSVVFVAMLKVAAGWFHDRQFATVSSLGIVSGNVGAVLSVAPFAVLVTHVSWRSVYVAAGCVSLVIAWFAWRHMRDRPSAAGFTEADVATAPEDRPGWRTELGAVIRNRDIWPGFVVLVTGSASYIAFVGLWLVPYLMQVHGMSRSLAAFHASTTLVGFTAWAFCTAWLSDRIGRRRPVIIGGLGLYTLCWTPIIAAVPLPLPASLALFLLLGASATGFTLCWSCAKEVSPPWLSGMSISFVNSGQFLGAGVLQPLVGWILDHGWRGEIVEGMRLYAVADYRAALGLLAACAAAGVIAACFMPETRCRNVHAERAARGAAAAARI